MNMRILYCCLYVSLCIGAINGLRCYVCNDAESEDDCNWKTEECGVDQGACFTEIRNSGNNKIRLKKSCYQKHACNNLHQQFTHECPRVCTLCCPNNLCNTHTPKQCSCSLTTRAPRRARPTRRPTSPRRGRRPVRPTPWQSPKTTTVNSRRRTPATTASHRTRVTTRNIAGNRLTTTATTQSRKLTSTIRRTSSSIHYSTTGTNVERKMLPPVRQTVKDQQTKAVTTTGSTIPLKVDGTVRTANSTASIIELVPTSTSASSPSRPTITKPGSKSDNFVPTLPTLFLTSESPTITSIRTFLGTTARSQEANQMTRKNKYRNVSTSMPTDSSSSTNHLGSATIPTNTLKNITEVDGPDSETKSETSTHVMSTTTLSQNSHMTSTFSTITANGVQKPTCEAKSFVPIPRSNTRLMSCRHSKNIDTVCQANFEHNKLRQSEEFNLFVHNESTNVSKYLQCQTHRVNGSTSPYQFICIDMSHKDDGARLHNETTSHNAECQLSYTNNSTSDAIKRIQKFCGDRLFGGHCNDSINTARTTTFETTLAVKVASSNPKWIIAVIVLAVVAIVILGFIIVYGLLRKKGFYQVRKKVKPGAGDKK